jgi:signal transduction histidine kinase
VELATQILGVELAKVTELLPSGDELLLRAGVGWRDGCVGRAKTSASPATPAGHALGSRDPVAIEDLAADPRFTASPLLAEHGVVSGINMAIHDKTRPYGVFGVYSKVRRCFTADDCHFIQSIADVLAAAIERRQLEEELVMISGRELRRIGQDLHDGLCQHLAGIEFRVAAVARQLERDPAARKEVKAIGELIQDATRQARMLARGLAPVELETNGLMAALAELAEDCSKLYRIDCRFHCDEPVLVANQGTATHIYRIAQEAISNAVRHATAKKITVSLERDGQDAVLAVTNNGNPLPSQPGRSGGMGLRTMRYRADLIGAALRLDSTAKGKTRLTCAFNTAP